MTLAEKKNVQNIHLEVFWKENIFQRKNCKKKSIDLNENFEFVFSQIFDEFLDSLRRKILFLKDGGWKLLKWTCF